MRSLEEILEEARALREELLSAGRDMPDNIAVKHTCLYDSFDPNGHAYAAGDRFVFNGRLCKVKDGMAHTSQPSWTPDTAASLYEYIPMDDETGTADNPIAYAGNMKLYEGKYYTQDSVKYRCIRDSGIALVHPLSALVGSYVEIA